MVILMNMTGGFSRDFFRTSMASSVSIADYKI